MEIWKTIEEFSRYEISNFGSIRDKLKDEIFSEFSIDRSGFYRKKLMNDEGKKLSRPIHKLVAKAFIPNPSGYSEVIPINGNKLHNYASNLIWGNRVDYYKKFPKKIKNDKKIKIFCKDEKNLGEEWKDIPETQYYKISNMGRYFDPNKGIKNCESLSNGYIVIRIKKEENYITKKAHLIIGELFVENNGNKHLIFIDGNKLNIKYNNLKWVSWDEKEKYNNLFKPSKPGLKLKIINEKELDPFINEIWKTIIKYDNYEISSFGRIRNKKTGHIKTTSENSSGYYEVTLWKNNKNTKLSVRRLVSENFLKNEKDKKFLINIDGNKENNKLNNLIFSDTCDTYNIRIDHKIEQHDEFGLINIWDSFKNIISIMDITYKELNNSCVKNEKACGFYWRIYIESDIEGEIWKSAPYFDEKYEVSNKGRIRNRKTQRHLSLHVKNDGYVIVSLKDKNSYIVHRMVGKLFINKNNEEQNEINHIDGNKQNNKVENLEWCTRKENMQHAFDNGLINLKKKSPFKIVENIEGEIWKDINKHPNYKISNFGRISKNNYLVSQYIYVYPRVSLKKKTYLVHRLLAMTFIPNLNNLPVVNHKDGNKENNLLSNLEWISYSENIQHANDNGLIKYKKAQKIDQYTLEGEYIKTWPSISKAGKGLNISKYTIIQCLRGVFSTAGLYLWKYNDIK